VCGRAEPVGRELEAALDIQSMSLHLQGGREEEWKRRKEEYVQNERRLCRTS
jgi:hypothetical protein